MIVQNPNKTGFTNAPDGEAAALGEALRAYDLAARVLREQYTAAVARASAQDREIEALTTRVLAAEQRTDDRLIEQTIIATCAEVYGALQNFHHLEHIKTRPTTLAEAEAVMAALRTMNP